MKQSEKNYNYKRIVVKIGSSLIRSEDGDYKIFHDIIRQIADQVKTGKEIVVVSSGAIALGMQALGLKKRPKELYNLQATAAVGQHMLMNHYRKFFKGEFDRQSLHGAQVLLTWEDFVNVKRKQNTKNTLTALLKYGTVPIVNENDTVSTEEIKFGDNDRLSALVAKLISADILIILSDVDGLLDKNKTVIPIVEKITARTKKLACPTNKETCVGGMVTKIDAAKIAVGAGIPCVIANGRTRNIIEELIKEPEKHGTLFLP